MELSESNVIEYLRAGGRVSAEGEILVQKLSEAESENVVLKIFDTAAGERVGTDLRTPGQIKLGKPDTRMTQGDCFVLKQPRSREGAALDLARIGQERACLELLAGLLPAGSVPEVRWFDEAAGVLAMSSPPTEAVVWQKQMSAGTVTMDAATLSGMLLAMIHSSTKKDAAVRERFADGRILLQRLEPILKATAVKHPALGKTLQDALFRLKSPLSLIHGSFRPRNILLVPGEAGEEAPEPVQGAGRGGAGGAGGGGGAKLAQVTVVDFAAATFGHNAFDVVTLVVDLLLQGFLTLGRWRAFMLMADNFWQTYRHTADPELVRAAEVAGGRLLGALLLARLDGGVGGLPMKEFAERKEAQGRIRGLALAILKKNTISLDEAIDEAAMHFDPPQQEDPPKPKVEPRRHDGNQGMRRRGHR